MPVSESALKELRVKELKKICEKCNVLSTGSKTDLISRILSEAPEYELDDESDSDTSVQDFTSVVTSEKAVEGSSQASGGQQSSQMMTFMAQMLQQQQQFMMQQQQESMKQQQEFMEKLMSSTVSQRRLSRQQSSESIASVDTVGDNPTVITDRMNWLFEDIKRKISNLNKDISNSLGGFVYQESLKLLIQAQEKLNTLIGDKKSFLEDSDKETQCLKGAASHCLDGFSPLQENYLEALEHVKARFGQPRKVVRHIMKTIVGMPTISSNDPNSLRKGYDWMLGKLHFLSKYSTKVENPVDVLVLPILESKLTNELKHSWEKELIENFKEDEFATVERFSEWFSREVRAREALIEPRSAPQRISTSRRDGQNHNNNNNNNSGNSKPFSGQALATSVITTEDQNDQGCQRCSMKNHKLQDCGKFRKDPVENRWELAKSNGLCFKCLNRFHPGTTCDSTCSVKDCKRRHHTLLHSDSKTANKNNDSSITEQNKPNTEKTQCNTAQVLSSDVGSCSPHISSGRTQCIMPSASVTLHGNNGKTTLIRVAFDTMCQDSFITERAANLVGLKYEKNLQMEVNGFGEKVSSMKTARVQFGLSNKNNTSITYNVDALIRPGRICTPLDAVEIDIERCEHLKNIYIADKFPRYASEVDVLIGLNHYLKLVTGSIVRHPTDTLLPAAIGTVFGFVLAGPNSCLQGRRTSVRNRASRTGCLFSQVRVKTPLEKSVERFWELDSIGIKDTQETSKTQDEKEAMRQFNESITFDGERYSVGLPFKPNSPELKNNLKMAERQMLAIERRMENNPKLRQDYEKGMQDYETLGFARRATEAEKATFIKGPQYFIPHHAVIKKERVTTKTRIVFNASCPDENGNSLNDCLLTGPALQPDIGKVLIRFRIHQIALMGDIAKMFCQTKIHPKHYCYQQYLWRHFDKTVEPIPHIMLRVMFGVGPSPFLAIGSVQHHSRREDMCLKYPKGTEAAKDIYVDDYCGGGENVPDVIELSKQLREFFAEGGWKMTKFASNSTEVMESIPKEDRLIQPIVDFDDKDNGFTKALGIGWDVRKDIFQFKLSDKLKTPLDKITKRNVLSKVSQVYDIFGFYAAFTIRAKILIQGFWESDKTWDEELTGEISKEFRQWEQELLDLETISIPRILVPPGGGIDKSLIAFADASQKAYGAVVYLRCVDDTQKIRIQPVIAKTRVAPRKSKTLARLELLAVLLATQLVKYVMDALSDYNIENTVFFTDSTIALAWIQKPSTTWKTFVANRVQEIQDSFDAKMFHHVPGKHNPADVLSRGCSVKDLRDDTTYWNGPKFLQQSEETWLKTENIEFPSECAAEQKRTTVMITQQTSLDIIARYESYMKCVRVVAHILKWKRIVTRTADGSLTPDSLKTAEITLIRTVQKKHFPDEIDNFESGKCVDRGSVLTSLDPKFDNAKKLIIVGGRLSYSDLPEETKHQIILPGNDDFTEKLILYYHTSNAHAPIETTLALTRQKYWIVNGRREVSKAIRKCVTCRHFKTTPLNQKMGPLPADRTCIAPAFTNVGLEFTGPVLIKNGGEVIKGYICLFTCMQSRMVHLELTNSMETADFLQALRRMLNRRGICKTIVCDNFTSFKKAQKLISGPALKNFSSDRRIEWNFITERSPFRGGFYERLNQSLKHSLKRVLGKALLAYEEMYTVLTDIESVINQRPLTYQSSDHEDYLPITPAHLALGRPLSSLPDASTAAVSIRVRYKYLQRLQDHFWKRWAKEYLPTLQTRCKWKHEKRSIKLNDICLITEDNQARSKWPLGRVIELIAGKDGFIRTVRLKTSKGVYTRPVQKLHLFEEFKQSSPTETAVDGNSQQLIESDTHAADNENNNIPEPSIPVLRNHVSQGGEDVGFRTFHGRISYPPNRYQAKP